MKSLNFPGLPRVLVIDDEEGIREGLRTMLQAEGVAVETATTAATVMTGTTAAIATTAETGTTARTEGEGTATASASPRNTGSTSMALLRPRVSWKSCRKGSATSGAPITIT